MLDLVIKNAKIVDGSGAPARIGSVGVRNGMIEKVGDIDEPAKQTLDARGRVVSPGFIDVHTHYDAQVFWDPTLSPSCYHGVTTVFGGFCGFSIAPLSREAAPYLLRMLARVEGMPVVSLEKGVPWSWTSFSDYLGLLDGRMGVNAGFMAGHSAIRCFVMGEKRARTEKATKADIEAMKKLLAQSLSQGAMGFSSTRANTHNDDEGLPVPSRHAAREEFVELAGVCRDFEGTSLELLPGIGKFSPDTIQLMVDMSVAAQRPLNWNALHAGDRKYVEYQLAAADLARKSGGDIIALTTPQQSSSRLNLHGGFVFDALGGWEYLFRLPIDERIRAFKDPSRREELDRRAKTETSEPLRRAANWEDFTVDVTFTPENKKYEGRTIGEIAAEQGKKPLDTMLDIAIADGLRTSFIQIARDDNKELWKHRGEIWVDDRAIIGASDAGAHLDMIDTFAFSTQVLSKGVNKFGVISLEQAVRQMTSVPAALFGLRQRGLLAPGHHADIVVFDAEKVGRGPVYMRRDLPGDEARVYADATGIDHVFVNGTEIVREGQHTGALPGKVLRSGVDTHTPHMPVQAGAK